MSHPIADLLAEKSFLVADGAMGTNLFAQGLMSGDSPEFWNVEFPERIRKVHQDFVDAGSDLILTNSFGGNRHRLKLHEVQGRVGELNRAAARVAREVADGASRKVLVCGSIGPTGEIFQPVGALSHEEGVEAFAEQAIALAEGGADVLWIETISAQEEMAAAVEGAARAGLPIVTTMSFDTNGRTMMGLTPEAALGAAHVLPVRPIGFGANCGIGPAQLLHSILSFRKSRDANDIIVAKGNCGVPEYVDGAIKYSGSPEVMANYARLARDAGAQIIGGCCGTSAVHVRAMREALDSHVPAHVPSISEIEALLGPVAFSGLAPTHGGGGEEPSRRRNRRRD
ncbi:MAG TPA: betaine--homocysteine S-methyltransferase [Geminicoccus sp.]|jgi:5-methyltetrahydrofolate--homocysteine methyltransferase|uniref:betaine--homocysteine S-methyltransferase n=1 Tax=Geminicoccus sp. TaxID=2024832 RepID=UPI002E335CE6|nr:betaine--homocysteine S-methyltransferase [Geminicoccus sp.]HEX2525980.1 betaine--homocysteine S-methyltransferase [Geminicoccus sp.]